MARVLSDETTLSRQRKQLDRESRVLARLWLVWSGLALLFVVFGVVLWLKSGERWALALAGVFAFMTVAHYLKPRENARQSSLIEAGLKGEVEVTRALVDGLNNRYYVFNDLNVRSGFHKAQMDHVVVGPCGVVVIETKNWRGRMVGDQEDKAWQQYRFEDSAPRRVSNPVLQNRRHVDVVAHYLKARGIPDVPLIPLLVFTAKNITLEISNLSATVLFPREVCEHIGWLPAASAFDGKAQDVVVNAFQRCLK